MCVLVQTVRSEGKSEKTCTCELYFVAGLAKLKTQMFLRCNVWDDSHTVRENYMCSRVMEPLRKLGH